MKNSFIIICVLLMFVPPVQAHFDALVFDVNDTELHVNDFENDVHQNEHHQNDSEDEKNENHHHHCTMLGFSSAIISPINTYSLIKPYQVKKDIFFHKSFYSSDNLDRLFQPPRA